MSAAEEEALSRPGQRRAVFQEFPILDALRQGSNVSQRALAHRVDMAVGAVNRYLRHMIQAGHIEVVNPDVRPFAYRLTTRGQRYWRELSHGHFRWLLGNVRALERRIGATLSELRRCGAKRVVFYGADEVMETAYRLTGSFGLQVVGVVDNDPAKRGSTKGGLIVTGPVTINQLAPDAVVITSPHNAQAVQLQINRALRSSIRVCEL